MQADDGADHAELAAAALQPRRLLDVQLEVGADREPAHGHRLRADRAAEQLRCGLEGGAAGGVGPRPVACLQQPARGGAAEQTGPEAHPLLTGPGHHVHPRRHPGLVERLGDLGGGDHAERAVVAPAARDGVQVRADQQARLLAGAAVQVGGAVLGALVAERSEPRRDQLPRPLLLGGQREPGDAPVRIRPDRRQRLDPLGDPGGRHRRQRPLDRCPDHRWRRSLRS
jgi:hypothetical protein